MTWLFIRFDCLEIKTWFAKTTLKVAMHKGEGIISQINKFNDQFKLMLGVDKCWTKSVANEFSKVKSI